MREFEDVFEGLGKFSSKVSVQLKEGSIPSLLHRKLIPLSLHARLKQQLSELDQNSVVSRVDYPRIIPQTGLTFFKP